MASAGRKELLCAQVPLLLTGVDFLWVNPANHRELAVFFVVEPNALTRPINPLSTEFTVTITGHEDDRVIAADSYTWVSRVDATGATRLTLTILTQADGGFQIYTLQVTDTPDDLGSSRIDPFCDTLDFSFKQGCPSPFDCAATTDCPPSEIIDYPVDYLARDFESFRAALSTFAADRYPDRDIDMPADFGAMVFEMFAALGDEFAFIQDGFKREGHLETLRERRSFSQLARLLDYRPDPGQSASGLIVARLYAGTTRPLGTVADCIDLPAGVRVWADQEDRPPVPFEVGDSVAQMVAGVPAYPLHTHWTDLAVYQPDPHTPCLERGARSLLLNNADLLSGPFPPDVLAANIGGYWQGKTLLIETRPDAPDAPVRRHLVTLDQPAVQMNDPLTGAGPLTWLHWREEDALPWGVDQGRAFVSANLVPIRAGALRHEDFVVGQSADPALATLPRSLERQGPMDQAGNRPVIHRHSLAATAVDGLDWTRLTDAAGAVRYTPAAMLLQLDPDAGMAVLTDWRVGDAPLSLAATDEGATMEPGLYGAVARFTRNGQRIVHHDYIGDPGYTLRFGDGTFGRLPTDGDVFRLFWRSGPGRTSNVPADTIARISPPDGAPPPVMPLPPQVLQIRNPFALTNGRDPQSLDLAKRIAPAAFKERTFRAVRNADYRAQAERLEWVTDAGAVTRWTGTWATTFVSADPKGAFTITPERMAQLRTRMGAVRQVGRPVITRQPVFVALDLRIAICPVPGYAFGDVSQRVLRALDPASGGYFHPDRFTFGQPLRRPDLEAAIGRVAGVRAVFDIMIRQRGSVNWTLFNTPRITVADNRNLKVENNPDRPGQGSIQIFKDKLPQLAEVTP
ncbi:hypothetical protein [Yoonia sp.]|uniref:hypothetical protein n=1 Tax=Yoonia sp. TaxID=2212373 RepID=UPI0025F14438|nr:hypothetical protein [Yoonia sp.]